MDISYDLVNKKKRLLAPFFLFTNRLLESAHTIREYFVVESVQSSVP